LSKVCELCGIYKPKRQLMITSKFTLCPNCFINNGCVILAKRKSEMDIPFPEQLAVEMNVQMSLEL